MPEPKCTLPDQELIERCNEWVHSLAKSGGQSWVLQVPVNFNRDPDMLFIELGKRFETLKAELEQSLLLYNNQTATIIKLKAENSKMRLALEKSLEWIADIKQKDIPLDDKKGMTLYHIKWLAIEALKTT